MNATPIRHYDITRSLSHGTPEISWLRLRLVAAAVPALLALLGLAAIAPDGALPDGPASPADPSAERAQRYADAVQAFGEQPYAVASGPFAEPADESHVPSAHLAPVMPPH